MLPGVEGLPPEAGLLENSKPLKVADELPLEPKGLETEGAALLE